MRENLTRAHSLLRGSPKLKTYTQKTKLAQFLKSKLDSMTAASRHLHSPKRSSNSLLSVSQNRPAKRMPKTAAPWALIYLIFRCCCCQNAAPGYHHDQLVPNLNALQAPLETKSTAGA